MNINGGRKSYWVLYRVDVVYAAFFELAVEFQLVGRWAGYEMEAFIVRAKLSFSALDQMIQNGYLPLTYTAQDKTSNF